MATGCGTLGPRQLYFDVTPYRLEIEGIASYDVMVSQIIFPSFIMFECNFDLSLNAYTLQYVLRHS